MQKRENGRIQRLPKFFGYPLLSQERGKLQISNLASTFRGSIRIKAHENFWRKGSVGVSRDCPNFWGTPYYLRNGKSYGFQILHAHLWAQSEQKPIKNSGKVAVGIVRDSGKRKIFRAPIHWAHRAVIFAIAQLSCCTSKYSACTTLWCSVHCIVFCCNISMCTLYTWIANYFILLLHIQKNVGALPVIT